jgi:hypothetical protein
MKTRLVIVGVLLLLALLSWLAFKPSGLTGVKVPQSLVPAPVMVQISHTNTGLRIFPGVTGAFIILPDSSLWSWGVRLFSTPQTPVQIGTDRNWVAAFAANNHCVGLRADGSIWEWGHLVNGQFTTIPAQVGEDHDWMGITAGDVHTVALKRDGTLWSWGDNSMLQLGNGPGPSQPAPVQIGTNHNWRAIACGQGSHTLALDADGTVWVWGTTPGFRNGEPAMVLSTPTRMCRESDWIGFAAGPGVGVLTQSGQWLPFEAPPDPNARRSSVCRLISTNSQAGTVALAFCGRPEIYRVSSDGRLWSKPFPFGMRAAKPSTEWRQVGDRTDWSLVCGSGTALGYTTNGTLWVWGTDSSQEPILDRRSRYRLFEERLLTLFGLGGGGVSTSAQFPYQEEPRPVLQWTLEPPKDR